MLAFGAGGLDVALAMSGQPYYITMPEIIRVNLTGKLHKFVSAKDVILELLRRLTVKGGVGKIFEYAGDGVKTLTVPERATITNMGTELGLTTSLFPSDEVTEKFLSLQKRGKDYVKIEADPDAEYDGEITINLSEIVPLAACPHSPDRVLPVSEIGKIKIDQCCIGSCTNSSYEDLMKAAMILKGKTVNDKVSLTVSPGSKQVFDLLAQNGGLSISFRRGQGYWVARPLHQHGQSSGGFRFAPLTGTLKAEAAPRMPGFILCPPKPLPFQP